MGLVTFILFLLFASLKLPLQKRCAISRSGRYTAFNAAGYGGICDCAIRLQQLDLANYTMFRLLFVVQHNRTVDGYPFC
jgi:hypothetical protein